MVGTISTWSSHVFGYQTIVADIPGTGTQTFAAVSRGHEYSIQPFAPGQADVPGNDTDGSGTVAVDYAQRTVTVRVSVNNTGQAIDIVSGTGTLLAGTNQFRGTLTGSTVPLNGTFTGTVFGPHSAEVGVDYALSGDRTANRVRYAGMSPGSF